MKKVWLLRFIKLFVLFGIPTLGLVYAYQFTNQPRAGEEIVPFQPFRMPATSFHAAGDLKQNQVLELKSPITVVNFWATWCPPCVEEFPAMLELERQTKGQGVEFVFVSIDETFSNVDKFVATYLRGQRPQRLLWDPKRESATAWGSSKFPETYVIRRDGWVVEKIIGLQMWTRPIVVKYFNDLAKKFVDLQVATARLNQLPLINPEAGLMRSLARVVLDGAVASARAETATNSADNNLGTAPIIHDQDKKNLEKLRKNIETATQNLQKAEAAQKEEARNLKEQQVVHERRQKEQAEAEEDLAKIQSKAGEVQSVIGRTRESIKTEQGEKKKIEGEIAEIRKRMEDLEKRLDRTRDDLTQANKGLNSRVQNLETLDKAEESSKEELGSLNGQVGKAKSLVKERKSVTGKAEDEIRQREKRTRQIEDEVARAKKSLEEQKNKLDEFEKILRK